MKLQEPLVSVVIPNFNGSAYLPACLESVRRQTYRNIEMIVVDDQSTDDSIAVIGAIALQDQRVQLLVNSSRLGAGGARNAGILASRGAYLTTLDSDDLYLDAEKIASELKLVRSSASPMVAYSGIGQFLQPEGPIHDVMAAGQPLEGDVFLRLLVRSGPIPRDFMLSRALLDRVGHYDPAIPIYEDWDLKLRIARHARFAYTGRVGVGYRQHATGLSSAAPSVHRRWMRHVFSKNAAGLPERKRLYRQLVRNSPILGRGFIRYLDSVFPGLDFTKN